MKANPLILIDSREQAPFPFSLPVEVGTLTTGDYSVRGLTGLIAVERKSLADLLACCGHGRDRFRRELARLSAYRFRLLIVETTAAELERGGWRSSLLPAHVLGSLASWSARFALPVWLGGDHASCGRFCERFLIQSARHVCEDYSAASAFLAATGHARSVEPAPVVLGV